MVSNRRATLRALAASALGAGAMLVATGPLALANAADYEWPPTFNVVTPVVGTGNHSLAVAWSAKFSAATGSRVAVLPAQNGFARAAWLNTGEGRLALVQASDYFDQMDAVQGYASKAAGPTDTRLIHINMVAPWGYAVRGDSKIKSIEDIGPGTRIALAKSSSFLVSGVEALLAYRGLKREDVQLVEVGSYGANTAVLVEGRVDVTFTSPLSGTSYRAEAGPNGLRWLELPAANKDPEAWARYRSIMTGYVRNKASSGVKSAIGLNMDHAFQGNHVRGDEDPEFVYQLVKWLDENHDSFKKDFTHAHMLSVDNLVAFLENGALQPLHEGAIRYLKEKGLWKDGYQARQDKLVEMAQARAKAFKAAMAEAEQKGIEVQPGNAPWMALWTDYRKQHGMGEPFGRQVLSMQ
ncbi:MAG: TAXI family TRAP transporter solute-binding subunit [Burkholderiales bacterium]|nr:MAG: TAXI family TRAP transporter solute-binding subunit [Burkholderiales bacterium]